MLGVNEFIEAGREAFAKVGPEACAVFDKFIVDQREFLNQDQVALTFAGLEKERLSGELSKHILEREQVHADWRAAIKEVTAAITPIINSMAAGYIASKDSAEKTAGTAPVDLVISDQRIEEWSSVVRTCFDKLSSKSMAGTRAYFSSKLYNDGRQVPDAQAIVDDLGVELFARLLELTELAWVPANSTAEPAPVVTPPPKPSAADVKQALKRMSGPRRASIFHYLTKRGPVPNARMREYLHAAGLVLNGELTSLGRAVADTLLAEGPSVRAVRMYGPFNVASG